MLSLNFFNSDFLIFVDTKHIASLPVEIHKILKYIDELDFQNVPDYEYISAMLKRAAARKHASITIKFDWEESGVHRNSILLQMKY